MSVEQTPTEHSESPGELQPVQRHPVVLALHLIGYMLGLTLMGYCVHTAVKGGAVRDIADASTWQIIALLACSAVSVVAHGTAWWLLMRPIQHLLWTRVQAINSVASLFFYAPLKLSVIARVALHRRADGLGYGLMAAWFVAGTGCLGVAVVAILLASALHGSSAPVQIIVAGLVVVLGCASIILVARFHLVGKLLRGSERMLVHPMIVVAAVLLRLVDMSAMTVRLRIACDILHEPVSLDEAYALTIMPLIGGVVSPIGALGAREWLTGWFGHLTGVADDSLLQSAATIATTSEAAVLLPMTLLALVYLKPHRLFGGRSESGT
ncbi:MAG: hypothetical protein KAS72_10520 [Phycisphaerales bacterium]|nr:hypothetical protein [Phycisphaerales bacterium]